MFYYSRVQSFFGGITLFLEAILHLALRTAEPIIVTLR